MGGFDYPHGMAGTKRIQNIINGLKAYPDISIRVVVLRQSSQNNMLTGVHLDVPYETVMGDLFRSKVVLMAPLLFAKSRKTMRRLFRPDRSNVLYVYGPPSFDSLPAIRYARKLGFKVVFDIVEDFELSHHISTSLGHRIKMMFIGRLLSRIASVADGIVVISSHLETKYNALTSGKLPIHSLPISVDMELYPEVSPLFGNPLNLFYAGSFGVKDGIPVLLDAFDKLAAKRDNVHLVLTGAGTDASMKMLHERIEFSPYKDRIKYKGFLDDVAYYAALNAGDILCMPRIDIGYAQAGFPFKLGEYLATGKPVIASSVSDIPNLLRDRQEAMLVTPGNSDAIVEAAETLINDPVGAFAIGSRGKNTALRLFDYRVQSKWLRRFLYSIVGMA